MTQSGEQAADWQRQLASGLDAMRIALDRAQQLALVGYLQRLTKWNRRYNLTAVRDPKALVARHVPDSISILPWVDSGPVLDVGTGAGLPGLPIAIVRPDLSLTLLDSNAKKLRFVRQAATELGLDNLDVVQQRMEQYRPAQSFDMVISRAVASIGAMYRDTAHLVRPGGRFLCMKGARPDAENAAFEPPGQLHVEALKVPGLDAERHLVWFEKQQQSGSMQL